MALRNLTKGDKVALIVNECQQGLLDPELAMFPDLANEVARLGTLPRIARLLGFFRDQGLPVLHTPVAHRPDFADVQPNTLVWSMALKRRGMAQGTRDVAFVPELEPRADEFVITRTAGMMAMNQTSLDDTLRRLGVTRLVLAGISSTLAMPGITMTAVDNGYHVFIPEDCIAGADPAVHRVLIDHQLRLLATITSSDTIIGALG